MQSKKKKVIFADTRMGAKESLFVDFGEEHMVEIHARVRGEDLAQLAHVRLPAHAEAESDLTRLLAKVHDGTEHVLRPLARSVNQSVVSFNQLIKKKEYF